MISHLIFIFLLVKQVFLVERVKVPDMFSREYVVEDSEGYVSIMKMDGHFEMYEPGSFTPLCITDSPTAQINCTKPNIRKLPDPPYSNCRIVISEINSDNPGAIKGNLYIELEEVCFQTVRSWVQKLKNFKLVVIEGSTRSLVMVANLNNVEILPKKPDGTKNRFVVLGMNDVPNVNVHFRNSEIVQSVFNNPGSTVEFPQGDSSPYSVILLHSTSSLDLRDITLKVIPGTPFFERRPIDEPLLYKLRKHSQDMVVFARKAHTNRCEIFERLWIDQTILNPKLFYLLRDWDGEQDTRQDLSINRCTDMTAPFSPNSFKLGIPSPGTTNDCTGARFVLEEHSLELTTMLQSDLSPDDLPESCHSDQINMPNERYKRVSEEMYLHEVDREMVQAKRQCYSDPGPDSIYAEADVNMDSYNQRIKDLGGSEIIPPYDARNFLPEWIALGNQFLPEKANVLEDPLFQAWLRIKTTDTGTVKFYCAVCSEQTQDHFHIQRNRMTDIMRKDGYFSEDKYKNKQEIVKHLDSEVHALAEGYLREIYAQEGQKIVQSLLERQESYAAKLLLPTVRIVRSVYMETSTGTAFNQHKNIVNLQKANGVNLGIHAYHKTTASEISSIISKSFHDILLDSLIANDIEFTLLVDATTDSQNIPYLVVFIQTLENNRPTIYFYRLIELQSETADATMRSLWKAFEEDTTPDRDFVGYVIRRLIAFSSDGANVMIGKRQSLHVLLINKIGRHIPAIICMAHKLQNAIKRGIQKSGDPELQYFQDFENSINKFYNFYSSRGSKRWHHFEQTALDLGLRYARIKYFFDVRWSSSQYSALLNLKKDYIVLHSDTVEISSDTSFTSAARKTANDLAQILQDKTWSLVLHHMLDILNEFKEISENLQFQAGTLPGKYGIIQNGINKLNDLKKGPGAFLKEFLSLCTCKSKPCESSMCTVAEYEACEDLNFSGTHKLSHTLPSHFSLSEKNTALFESLEAGLKHYFNLEDLQHFELFNQKKYILPDCELPENSIFWTNSYNEVIPMDAGDHITYIGRFYSMSAEEISEIQLNWDSFFRQLVVNPSFIRNLKSDFEFFWTLVLKNEREELQHFPASLKRMIRMMLVTPFSTAECERAFSILTASKSKRRLLSAASMEETMRVSINGQSDYFKFKVLKPTQDYLKTHCRVDDDSCQGGRPPKPKPWSKLLPKSELF